MLHQIRGRDELSEIKLLELSLRNFKGIKDLKLTPGGNDLNIYGDNATGKTTIMDAFIWLLFDKDSSNSSNFNIKTLDKLGNVIHGLEHEVIAKLEIDSKVIELQKIYTEKWTKKRGQADSELTGHTTDYFINGVPKKLNEYKDYLKQIVDEDTFKILTNPLYFNRVLDWKKRRTIALDICGELSVSDVIDKNNKLIELKDLLIDKSIDDLKAEMAARRKKLNEELKSIPYRIDELSREDIEIDIAALTKEKLAIKIKLDEVKSFKGMDYDFRLRTIRGTITFLETESKRMEQEATQAVRDELNNAYEAKSQADKELFELLPELNKTYNKIEMLEETKLRLTENMEALRVSFKETSNLVFDEASTTCPTCHQGLPSETIESLTNHFETDKATKLENINTKGKELKVVLEQINNDIAELTTAKDNLEIKHKGSSDYVANLDEDVKALQTKLKNINIVDSKEYREIQLKLEELRKEETDLIDLSKKQDNTAQLLVLESQINDIDKQLAKVDLIKDNEKRIKELSDRERELSQMIVETEKIEFLCDQFVITKSNLLEDKLNSKFNIVKFKLFDVQVNGGINETFVTTVDGVPFEDLNNAMKINAGLDIINTLTDYYNFKAPIFIDNRESVNSIVDVKSQVINLIVSKDKNLKMEVEG